MLTTSELTSMRAMAAQALPDRCNIVRVTITPDGKLNQIEAEEIVAYNVPCRLEEARGQPEAELGGRIASRGESTLRLPYDTPVLEADLIDIDSRRLSVQRVTKKSFATVTTVIASEVR